MSETIATRVAFRILRRPSAPTVLPAANHLMSHTSDTQRPTGRRLCRSPCGPRPSRSAPVRTAPSRIRGQRAAWAVSAIWVMPG